MASGTTFGKGSQTLEPGAVISVTLSLDTSQYADNDVLAAPQEVTNFFRTPGGRTRLNSIVWLDKDDNTAGDTDILFLNAAGSIGNENSAFSPTDAVADTIIGAVVQTSSDYIDCDNSQLACKRSIGLDMQAAAGSTSAWLGAVVRSGTPTHTASGITVKLGVTYLT